MLRSCKFCGRIHEASEICGQKKAAEKRRQSRKIQTAALQFRRSSGWTRKSMAIRGRDQYICLCCKAMLPGTVRQFNTSELSVHHITPIEEDYSMRLDDHNLITVCKVHHEMCERGEIPRDRQRALVIEALGGDTHADDPCIVV